MVSYPSDKLRVALILGSARKGRFCERVAKWAAGRIEAEGRFDLDVIDPRHVGLGLQESSDAELRAVGPRLGKADGFVVVTPEYNHGYPAALKQLIDSFYAEWQGKPVAFVSYGGAAGGARAVEQLRQVFAELHTTTVRDVVTFQNAWERFSEDGELQDPRQAERGMRVLLSRLAWWATALREARRREPYKREAALQTEDA